MNQKGTKGMIIIIYAVTFIGQHIIQNLKFSNFLTLNEFNF